jgi:hypothetical protein
MDYKRTRNREILSDKFEEYLQKRLTGLEKLIPEKIRKGEDTPTPDLTYNHEFYLEAKSKIGRGGGGFRIKIPQLERLLQLSPSAYAIGLYHPKTRGKRPIPTDVYFMSTYLLGEKHKEARTNFEKRKWKKRVGSHIPSLKTPIKLEKEKENITKTGINPEEFEIKHRKEEETGIIWGMILHKEKEKAIIEYLQGQGIIL